MSSPDRRMNELKESYPGKSHKRKHHLRKQKRTKSHGQISLTSNSHAGNEGNITFDLPPRTIGDDGNYYECIVCDIDGDLICCDTCPNTYHLHCLSPPLESAPDGDWQCQNCSEGVDLSTPLISLVKLKKKASSNKNPAAALHSLAEAGHLMEKASEKRLLIDEEQNVVNHNCNAKESEISAATNGIKVYKRRPQKKADEDKIAEPSLGFFNSPIDLTEEQVEQKESDPKPEAQGDIFIFQAMKTSPFQTPNVNQVDKLWLLRDTMQALMNSQGPVQNNARKELYQTELPKSDETFKEKYARLRVRQKQRIALSNRSSPVIPGSRVVGHEPRFQYTGSTESVRVHVPEKCLKQPVLLNPLPLSYISPPVEIFFHKSADHINSHLNSSKNLSILRDPRRFRWNQDKSVGKEPVFSWHQNSDAGNSTMRSASFQERGNREISSQILNLSAVPRGDPWLGLGSNIASSSKSTRNSDSIRMGSNSLAVNQGMMTLWLDQELDSLWIGIRKYGVGKWEDILKDSFLYFSELKTAEDLAQRWKWERLRMLNSEDLPTSEVSNLSTELRLNSLQYSEYELPQNQGRPGTQRLFLGGLIGISKARLDMQANLDGNQIVNKEEKEVSSESTISE